MTNETNQHRTATAEPGGGEQWEPGPAAVPDHRDRTPEGDRNRADRSRQWDRNRNRLTGGGDGRTRPRHEPVPTNGGFGFLDPPAAADTGGSGSGAPRVSELIGRVVCAIAPAPDVVQSQKYGELEVARLRWLIVFEPRTGTPTAYPDYLFFQYRLRRQVLGRPATLGRLLRPGQAYELEPVGNATRERAGTLMVEGGWIAADGTPAAAPEPMPGETYGRRWDEYEDDEGAF